MKINILLPGIPRKVSGGVKVIFEYANELAKNNNDVNIYFNCNDTLKSIKFMNFIRKIICKIATYIYPKWFVFEKGIKKKCVFSVTNKTIDNANFIFATAIQTANPVKYLSEEKGKKLYLIQGFENWTGYTNDEIYDTYKLGMKNIVVSKWLKNIVDKHSREKSILIKNGIDCSIFKINKPIEKRNKYSIAMLYHIAEYKGCKYGIKVLSELKKEYPDLDVTLFGVYKKPKNLPKWIKYIYNPSRNKLVEIYNNAAIYICPTLNDGFGLTGAESMACGCAFISTDYGGQKEYSIENENVLLSLPKDINAMKKNLELVIENDLLRIRLAKNGNEYIRKNLNKENSINLLKQIIYNNKK